MTHDICCRPSIFLLFIGLGICVYAFVGADAYAGSPELRKVELYREIEAYSTLQRDGDGVLEVSLDRRQIFEGSPPVLKAGAREKLHKLTELMALEGVRTPTVYSQTDVSAFDENAITDAEQRVRILQDYLEDQWQSP